MPIEKMKLMLTLIFFTISAQFSLKTTESFNLMKDLNSQQV